MESGESCLRRANTIHTLTHLNYTLFSPVCDSYVRPETLVRICDECNFGTYGGRCIICGSPGKYFVFRCDLDQRVNAINACRNVGISDAYYCAECTRLEKDRDGCPKIVNLGASRTDLFYERRRLGESDLFNIMEFCLKIWPQASRKVSREGAYETVILCTTFFSHVISIVTMVVYDDYHFRRRSL
jgi:hypothetical protein